MQDVIAGDQHVAGADLDAILGRKAFAQVVRGFGKAVLGHRFGEQRVNCDFMLPSSMRSCGRFGPGRGGFDRGRGRAPAWWSSCSPFIGMPNRPCALKYAAKASTSSAVRPVDFMKSTVTSSTGKKPIVAPYSGAMLAIVARSGSASVAVPGRRTRQTCRPPWPDAASR